MNKYDTEIELNKKSSLTYTISKITPDSTVLEFGPATGYMTRYLKEQKGCRVSIVEIDRDAYETALHYAEDGICCDAEQMEWLDYFKDKKFDYITFSDVLEHLREPNKVLCASRKLLRDNGKIITSIPNIGHNAVLIDLYNNKFQYRKTGILDNTHLRFFTYGSMKELFQECGLKVVDEDAIVFDLQYVGFGNTEGDVPENFWREIEDREYGFVNQFLFTLSLNADDNVEKYSDKKILEAALYYTKDENEEKFNEENKVVAELVLGNGNFQVDYDLTGLAITAVRIEPIERYCVIEKIEARMAGQSVTMVPAGGFELKTGGRGFIADIPKYEAFVGGSGILHVCGTIRNIELSDINMYVRAETRRYLQEKCDLEAEISRLNQVIEEKQGIMETMNGTISDQNAEESRLNQVIEEKVDIIRQLGNEVGGRSKEIDRLNGEMEKLSQENGSLNQEIVRLNNDCALLGQEIQQREKEICKRAEMIAEKETVIAEKDTVIAEKDARIEEILNGLPKWMRRKFV